MRLSQSTIVVLTLLVGGCDEVPTSPSGWPFTGVWNGNLSDSVNGTGTLRLTLGVDLSNRVDGTWSARFANQIADVSGVVTGAVVEGVARLTLTPQPAPVCSPGAIPSQTGFVLVVTVSSTLSGASTYFGCSTVADGRAELRRQ